MEKQEMAMLITGIVSRVVDRERKNYGASRKALAELGLTDDQMVMFGFPKVVMSVLQDGECEEESE